MSDFFVEGLARLGVNLPEVVIEKEICFLDELLRWNQRINLTSIRDRNEAIEKHLLDSLLLLPHLKDAKHLLDMGSGGGLPGIPLVIARPTLHVVSVDSVGKKINFQKHVKRLLKLDNLRIVQSRVEDLLLDNSGQEKFELIVSRAFSSLEAFINHANDWLKPGGRLLAMKGPEGREELIAAAEAIERYGFSAPEVSDYSLPFSRAERQLITLSR